MKQLNRVSGKGRTGAVAALVVVAAAAMFAGAGAAASLVWVGLTSSAWNVANNWRDGSNNQPAIPQAADSIIINNPNTPNPCILPLPGSNSGNDFVVTNITIQPQGGNPTTLFGGLGASAGKVKVTGNFQNFSTYNAQNGHIEFSGTAAQTITSASQRMGNLTVSNLSVAGVSFLGSWNIGDAAFPQTLTVVSGARMSFNAAANFTNTTVANSGLLRFAASAASPTTPANQIITAQTAPGLNLGNVELATANGVSTITVNNPCQFGSITMTGAGNVTFTNAVTLTGNFTDTLGGTVSMPTANCVLTFAGTTPQAVSLSAPQTGNVRLDFERMVVNADADVTISGLFQARAKGSLTPAVLVDRPGTGAGSVGGKLTMSTDTIIRVNVAGGESLVKIDGRLTSSAGPGSSRPCFVGGDAPATRARVVVGQTAYLNLNGFVFDKVGSNASAYGITIADGATVERFDNVSVMDSNAVTAIIDLNTGNLPTKEFFEFLELAAAPGGAPRNIDANNISGFVLQLTAGGNSGGNRYGIAFEIDTNNVLAWDSAPAMTISNSSPLNPPATGDRPFQFNVTASGGNAPYTFATPAPANPPLVLVTQVVAPTVPAPIPVLYLNALTGVVSTDPLFRATNPTGFPGDPGYDAGQEPVKMPLANVGGVYAVTVICSDSSNPTRTDTKILQFAVQSPPLPVPQVNTFALPDGFEGTLYPLGVVISAVNSTPSIAYPGGNPGFLYSLGPASPDQLPAGLSLNAVSGAITGTVQFGAANGQPSELYEIDFMVTDIFGTTDLQRIDIRVFEGVPPLQLASGPPVNATEGVAYSFKLNALGGKSPYSWDLAPGSGPLPEGLFLAGNGQIAGTPGKGTSGATPPALYPVIFRVTDNLGSQLSQPATVIVQAPPPPILTLTPNRAGGGGVSGGCSVSGSHGGSWAILLLVGLAGFVMIIRRRTPAMAEAKRRG